MTSVRQREKAQRQGRRAAERVAAADSEPERTAAVYDLLRARIAAIRNRDRQDEAWRRLAEHLARFHP